MGAIRGSSPRDVALCPPPANALAAVLSVMNITVPYIFVAHTLVMVHNQRVTDRRYGIDSKLMTVGIGLCGFHHLVA